ncbi:MAG: Uma2 family endonuclease [Chloroflexi bacterium]|nr:Uma2 family endonuclease [Chloroflexota bacterium]
MIRIQVQFTENQVRALKELAHQERVSIAELARRAVDFWLQGQSSASNAETSRPSVSNADGLHPDQAALSEARTEYLVAPRRSPVAPPFAPFPRLPAPPPAHLRPPPLEPGDRLTAREFERRYEAMPHIKKAELIEGVVYMSSPVRVSHSVSHGVVMSWLGQYAASTPGLQLADNATLRLDPDNVVQPDALLRLDAARGGRSRVSSDDYFEGTPELIVEVATSSAAYDLHEKRRIYRRNGVQEYLVWQVLEGRLDWWELVEGEYVAIPTDSDGLMRSRVFPGLWLDPQAILAGNLSVVLARLHEGLATAEHVRLVQHLSAATK